MCEGFRALRVEVRFSSSDPLFSCQREHFQPDLVGKVHATSPEKFERRANRRDEPVYLGLKEQAKIPCPGEPQPVCLCPRGPVVQYQGRARRGQGNREHGELAVIDLRSIDPRMGLRRGYRREPVANRGLRELRSEVVRCTTADFLKNVSGHDDVFALAAPAEDLQQGIVGKVNQGRGVNGPRGVVDPPRFAIPLCSSVER